MTFVKEGFLMLLITLGVMGDVIVKSCRVKGINTHGYLTQLKQQVGHTVLTILVTIVVPMSQQICLHVFISNMKIYTSAVEHTIVALQLKCGGCSEVLKFSLKDGTHVVPFSSIPIDLPSRELHHGSEVINGGKLPSKTHVNHYHHSPAKPISYYDDYGLSVSQSFSSEVDPAFLTQQFDTLHSSEYVNSGVSPSSTFKAKIIGSRYFSTIAATTETDQSTELSSNMSEPRKLSPEKEARQPRKSTLHKLMGYSTPSRVIKGTP
ncbi:hypothetical protein RYX36_023651 [Vicia faba]